MKFIKQHGQRSRQSQIVRGLIGALLLVVLPMNPLKANDQTRYIDDYRDWSLFMFDVEQGKVCYISSRPVKEEGNYTRRGAAAVLVSRWPIDPPNEQVSVQSGYNYLSDSGVTVMIEDDRYELFTKGEHAWTRKSDLDSSMIVKMKKGKTMSVRGTSTKNTYSLDSYSLLGFTAAYRAMQNACK